MIDKWVKETLLLLLLLELVRTKRDAFPAERPQWR
jgi:hypothetical protein